MNLVVDIGNTLTKLAVFDGDKLVYVQSHQQLSLTTLNNVLNTYKPTKAISSSVKKQTESWERYLEAQFKLIHFSNAIVTGVKNHYQTPQTLGADRLAAVAGAHAKYPGKANLVIDAGTCITYDMIDADGNYFGGSISPGLNMRYKALNYYTAALPMLNADESFDKPFGNNTDTAIRSGVQNGVKYEVLGFIESYFKTQPNMNIILTGGDGGYFDTALKNSIFAPHIKNEPYLVLIGLNAVIQQHND